MVDSNDLHIELKGGNESGSTFRAVYRQPNRGAQLVPKLDYFQDEQKGPIARRVYRAGA
jgi:hypothetical protein